MSRRGTTYSAIGVGVAFGFLLTGSGLGDYQTIHDGLLLRDPYIYLMMASTVATAAAGLALLRRRGRTVFGEPLHIPRRPVRAPVLHGAAVFGVGFGVGATCPGITVSSIATGSWWGGVVLVGILAGLWLRGRVERRPVVSRPAEQHTLVGWLLPPRTVAAPAESDASAMEGCAHGDERPCDVGEDNPRLGSKGGPRSP